MTKQAEIFSEQRERAALKECQTARERALILLSLKAGLRAGEIAGLDWSHVDFEGGVLRLVNTKGDRPRVVPMASDLVKGLQAYAAERGSKAVGPVFVSTHANKAAPLSANACAKWLSDFYARRMGWKGYSSHSGRRTFVTRAARKISLAGGSLRDVQALAGHSSLATTQRYIATDPDAQRKLVDLI